jgi:hypothetical protein
MNKHYRNLTNSKWDVEGAFCDSTPLQLWSVAVVREHAGNELSPAN